MSTPTLKSDEVIVGFPAIGKYKVRLISAKRKPKESVLDIREFVESEKFVGFTRRGIRLMDKSQVALLRDILEKALGEME